ncbi:ebp domain-containing [Trichoderma arundinaceum]|uniref:Ebp domain-containing n=1 Tax=Trichoderma arundinaceum TaxID=490622 RepID=A0A395NLY0_TRIAR|nr:ebp domain-containing [Trichoderma arundinaceum]
MDHSLHPYHPIGVSIPNYVPNDLPLYRTLPVFAALIGVAVVSAYHLAGSGTRRRVRTVDRLSASWFALCYYVYNRTNIPGMNGLYAQLWKEYTLSDSRYLTSDIFTVCVEAITVFTWGPLSLLTLFCICTNHPSRHLFQIVVCVAHLYGVALYYATNWAEQRFYGVSYSRPEFLYFWVYYVGFNAPWAIVPFLTAFRALHEKESQQKSE